MAYMKVWAETAKLEQISYFYRDKTKEKPQDDTNIY
jgi:hypothetical protein